MNKETAIRMFQDQKVRTLWDDETEKWYFSIVDVTGILSESINPQAYWRKLKERLKAEGNETVTNCHALKMPAPDGKMRLTDVADRYAVKRTNKFVFKNALKTVYEFNKKISNKNILVKIKIWLRVCLYYPPISLRFCLIDRFENNPKIIEESLK